MERYILFLIEPYYPSGGWDDYFKSYATLAEATAAAQAIKQKDSGMGYHILDTHTWKKVTEEQ